MTPAETCRQRGWKVGDVLEGKQPWAAGIVERIRLTAIGREFVLAAKLHTDGSEGDEDPWALDGRKWHKVVPEKDRPT